VKKLIRHTGICLLLTGIGVLAFASKGGGGDKKNSGAFKNDFTPISSTGFTLKNGYSYSNSNFFGHEKITDKTISVNTMISFQKGNSIYIMPYHYKVNVSTYGTGPCNSSLQLVGVKIKMNK
jgi:hypothetical protein